jgi:2-polyprenyl-3-methyl-5-hydroxy-6-metoxy-1,4-benzoquinol methylase
MSIYTSKHEYRWFNQQPTDAHEYILPRVIELLPKSSSKQTILDIGCGNGFVASCLTRRGFTVTGVDASEEGIRIAQKEYPGIRFHVASAYDNLNSIVSDVDIVIATDVIEHMFVPRLLIENAYTVLKPRGMLIVTTPYHGYLKNLAMSLFNKWDFHHTVNWDGGHIKFFSEETMSELLNSYGFENITFHNVGRIRWLWKSMVCRCFKP